MTRLSITITLLLAALLTSGAFALSIPPDPPQTPLKSDSATKQNYPKIVLYSVSWCPHCKEAKEYFTSNEIPFINVDVEMDDAAMEVLTKKYKSQGVPVIVIGNDEIILKGFSSEVFDKAVKQVQGKKK